MAFRAEWRAIIYAVALAGSGALAGVAGNVGLWGWLVGATIMAGWFGAHNWLLVARYSLPRPADTVISRDTTLESMVLDAAPTPMIMIADGHARALNRAARRLFGADHRIVPTPAALLGTDSYLLHAGRHWRIDRVVFDGMASGRSVAVLIDVEHEERVGEARAAAEMIHVLGHELLNGLAPIISLAESGEAALDRDIVDTGLVREILGTLARRAEGLQRFTKGYRELARLPAPRRSLVPIGGIARDLATLFSGHWPGVTLEVHADEDGEWPLDRDQLQQAVWALLQNAAEAATDHQGGNARVGLSIFSAASTLVVEVVDNGAGVAVDERARIFRPFHTTKKEGTGIGLSLARQIALANGGSLVLSPAPPTTFQLTLPRVSAE